MAGLFIFRNKKELAQVPQDGEFVRWLSEQDIPFTEQPLFRTKEYGLYSEWDKLPKLRCRPFNRITIEGEKVIKEVSYESTGFRWNRNGRLSFC